ncbi:MAG: hypothetical protein WBM12_18105 [Pseudolabrys sp.]
MRRLFPFLVIIALVFGASYASTIIYRVMGPWSATAVEQDGNLTHIQFGSTCRGRNGCRSIPAPGW